MKSFFSFSTAKTENLGGKLGKTRLVVWCFGGLMSRTRYMVAILIEDVCLPKTFLIFLPVLYNTFTMKSQNYKTKIFSASGKVRIVLSFLVDNLNHQSTN